MYRGIAVFSVGMRKKYGKYLISISFNYAGIFLVTHTLRVSPPPQLAFFFPSSIFHSLLFIVFVGGTNRGKNYAHKKIRIRKRHSSITRQVIVNAVRWNIVCKLHLYISVFKSFRLWKMLDEFFRRTRVAFALLLDYSQASRVFATMQNLKKAAAICFKLADKAKLNEWQQSA